MSLRDELATVLAKDARFALSAYIFVFESIEFTRRSVYKKHHDDESEAIQRGESHVTGRQLCHGLAQMALTRFGMLARDVLEDWGIRSSSDVGDIVYSLIESGDLKRSPTDSRADFDNVLDFDRVFSQPWAAPGEVLP